ncbi:MAG: glycosyltransferase [Clostridia bacterium]|nr:glycosyltransferase [Clostridia bacterium]
MGRELAVLLPAYNESDNIGLLVERWVAQQQNLQNMGLDLHIIVIDDGSTDATKSICLAMQNQYSNFSFVSHQKNQGLGKAVETGIIHVLRSPYQCAYVVIMDCDNTHDPKFVMPMLKKIQEPKGKDVVIASRFRKGSKVFGVPFYRIVLSYGARFLYTQMLYVQNVRDYTCGYRLYKTEPLKRAVETFGGKFIEESGFACMVELLFKMSLSGSTFDEIPFELHYEDKLGESKMHVTKTIFNSLLLIKKLRRVRAKQW